MSGRASARRPAAAKKPARRAATAPRHAHAADSPRPLGCAILTVSDTRGPAEDGSGNAIARRIERAGHRVVGREWVKDDPARIRRAAAASLGRAAVDVLIATGGTGIAPRDRTPEALAPLIEIPLPGFGERFRALSAAQVGSAAWLSRAGAGIAGGKLVVFLPGSTRAVELAVTKLLIPELGHVARLLGRN